MIFIGSYGGRGGSPADQFLDKDMSVPYGDYLIPNAAGSSGGGSGPGRGGGYLSIEADEGTIDGVVSANGEDASTTGAGGGSGGGIYINIPNLDGSGMILARGGRGSRNGGGGSGGRISITSTNSFTGKVIADGGYGGE